MVFLMPLRSTITVILVLLSVGPTQGASPTTSAPTIAPTRAPTAIPTPAPTATPTLAPTRRSQQAASSNDPNLVGFTVDRGHGKFILTFDRLVNARSFDLSKFHLQSKESLNTTSSLYSNNTLSFSSYDLTPSGLVAQGNTTDLYFYLNSNNYAIYITKTSVCSTSSNCYLRADRAMVSSAFGYASNSRNVTHAFHVTNFQKDELPPAVVQFRVNMNLGLINFLFTEPVQTSTFSASGLAAQIASNVYTTGAYVQFYASGAYVVSSSNYDRNVTIQLGTTNLNAIKAKTGLWVDESSTYLSGWKPFINDTAGNNGISLASFEKLIGLKTSYYAPDVTPPRLLNWDFNFNIGSVSLFFSETVRVSFFNLSSIVIQSDYTPTVNTSRFRISNPSGVSTFNSDEYDIYLSNSQLDEVKLLTGIGRYKNSTYIILKYGAVVDTALISNVHQGLDATPSNPMKVRNLILDTTPPQVSSITVDMTAQTFTVFFSEVVSKSSMSLSSITFQSDKATGIKVEAVQLSNSLATVSSTKDGKSMTVAMKTTLFAMFKRFSFLTKSRNTTYFANTKFFVTDVAYPANLVLPLSTAFAKAISGYVPDTVAPTLVSWYPNMGYGLIKMTFSEPMNTSTFNFSKITLHSEQTITPSTIVYTLKESATLSSVDDYFSITVQMVTAGINFVKANPPLCTSYSKCFLTLSSGFGTDTATFDSSGKTIENAVLPATALQSTTSFVVDTVAPTLSAFSINMNTATIVLNFSEPVIFLATTAITLMDDSIGTNSMSVSEFAVIEGYGSVSISIILTRKDYIKLKSIAASSLVTSFVQLSSSAATDMSGNYLATNTGLMATAYVSDATVPAIAAIAYNSSSYYLTVYFNDLIIPSSVDLSAFNVISTTGTKIELSSATITTTSNTYALKILLSALASTLTLNGVSSAQSSLSLYISRAASVDDYPEKNTNSRMVISNAVGIGNAVVSFRLDMTAKKMILEFVHDISVASIVPKMFTLSSTISTALYTFSTFNGTSSTDSQFLTIKLSTTEYQAIQSLFVIANKSTIQLVIGKTAIVDSDSRTLAATTTVACSSFTKDSIAPKLSSYSVDMGTGILSLTFSEPVLISSLKLTSVTLSSSQSNASTIPISASSILTTSTNAKTVLISLNAGKYPNVREKMHISKTVGTSVATTYLYAISGWAGDTAIPANYISAIAVGSALQASSFTADNVPPTLLSTDIDMNARVLYMYFDEAVKATTNKPSYYTLSQDTSNFFGAKQSLTKSNTSYTLSTGRTIAIAFSTSDFDSIMYQAPNLCLSASNCYLSFRAGAVADISPAASTVLDVFFRYGVKITRYIVDTTPPVVTAYDVSLQNGFVDFFFNEVIQCTNPTLPNIVFQPSKFIGQSNTFYRLTTTATIICAYSYDKTIRVSFGLSNLISVKAISGLMKSASNTYMIMSTGAFKDASGTSSAAILDGGAMAVRNFYPDTVAPILQSFTVSAQFVLTLLFNEPVDVTTLVVAQITFQNGVPTFTKSYPLAISSVVSIDTYKMTIGLALNADYNRIAGNSNIFKSQLTTYLRATSSAIKDMSGNALTAIGSTKALIMGPSVQAWDFDMDKNVVYLYFSESVNSSFSPKGFGVQTSATSSFNSKKLSKTSKFSVYGSTKTTFVGSFLRSDINYMKYRGIAKSKATSFLTVSFGVTYSLLTNTIIPYLKSTALTNTSALAVQSYSPDISPPLCSYYNLDLNPPGTLTIAFDEPVVASSLVLTGLTLISKSVGSSATLSNTNRAVSDVNMTNLQILIPEVDLNKVKLATKEGILNGLLFAKNGVKDFADNYFVGNSEDSLISIKSFVADITAPNLVTSTLDLSKGIFTIDFDEPIDSKSLLPSNYYILSSNNFSTATYMVLTNYSFIEADNNGLLTINLDLYGVDSASLRTNQAIGETVNNTYIGYVGISDIFGNSKSSMIIHRVTKLIPDTNPLVLHSFDFQYSSTEFNNITFYFNKGVLLETFNCSDFVFQTQAIYSPSYSIRLSTDDCIIKTADVNASLTIDISVSSSVFNGVLGSSSNVTWVKIPSVGSTTDIYDNQLAATTSLYRYIRSGPQLVKYLLDMNTGVLTLIFSREIQREGVFDPTSLGFYSTTTGTSFTLSNDTVLTPLFDYSPANDSFAVIYLPNSDMSELKAADASSSQLYLFVDSEYTLQGTSGEWLAPISRYRKFTPAKFIADIGRPILLSITLDMSYEFLLFEFDEPVRASSVVASNFRIQSTKSGNGTSYKLTGGYVTTSGTTMKLQLLRTDAAIIKLQAGLAKSSNNSFVSFVYKSIADYSGNFLSSVPSTSAYLVNTYIADAKGPILNSFSLNMNNDLITFTFSEPVLASSINMTALHMQSRFFSQDGVGYRLTGGTVQSVNGLVIEVKLLPIDVFNMKMINGLVRARVSTYLVVATSFCSDLLSNPVVAILDGKAQPALVYTADQTAPHVQKIYLNVDKFYLTLTMSEPMKLTTVDVTQVSVQTSSTNTTEPIYFSRFSYVDFSVLTISPDIRIEISQVDMDMIKTRAPLFVNDSFTFVAFTALFATDTSNVPADSIPVTSARKPTTFIPDTTKPRLLTYSLDMTTQEMKILFSEAVDPASIDLTQLILQNVTVRRFGAYINLNDSTPTFGVESESTELALFISSDTINYMKATFIAHGSENTFLSWSDTFIKDFGGNSIPPTWDGSVLGFTPMKPTKYTLDITDPFLSRWYIDRSKMEMHMFFPESIELADSSLINLYLGTSASTAGSIPQSIGAVRVRYRTFQTEAILPLKDTCTHWPKPPTTSSQSTSLPATATDGALASCSPYTMFWFLLNSKFPLFLTMGKGAFRDLSPLKNPSLPVVITLIKIEGSPDCSQCGDGSFVSKNCTASSDRVCSLCGSCAVGTYIYSTCSSHQDTLCGDCDVCTVGNYISTACSGAQNTVCSPCTKCSNLEYESQECRIGLNTVCNSCQSCYISDPVIRARCDNDRYRWWALANCCFDLAGQQTLCNNVDRRNIMITARNGRHHWAFEETFPPITGAEYALGKNF